MTRAKTILLVGCLTLLLLTGATGATAGPPQRPTPAPPAAGGYYYTVHWGDTLSGIALMAYGNANMWGGIASANGIGWPNRIYAGSTLWIPVMGTPGYGGGGGHWY